MTPRYKRAFRRNQLYAVAVLPPALFLLTGHVVLGLVFLLCVVAARFSRPRRLQSLRKDADPIAPSSPRATSQTGARGVRPPGATSIPPASSIP